MLQTRIETATRQMPLSSSWRAAPEKREIRAVKSPLEALESHATRVQVSRGQEIFAEGDAPTSCYKIISGSVRLVKLMSDGHRQICEFLLPGDLLGFENEDERYFSAEAVADCVLVRYPRQHVESLLAENPAFARHMRKLTADGLQGAYQRMVLLCHKSAQERMAWFLLQMADRSAAKGNCVQLPMTRSDIADYLGMVIETVSRVLTQLKEAGVIAVQSVNRIVLVNREALEDCCGEI